MFQIQSTRHITHNASIGLSFVTRRATIQVALLFSIQSVHAATLEESLCGTCQYVRFTGNCKQFWNGKACDAIDPKTCLDNYCKGQGIDFDQRQQEIEIKKRFRQSYPQNLATKEGERDKNLNLRVAPAHYERPNSQNKYRVSVITKQPVRGKAADEWDYTGQFKWAWTHNYLNTKIVTRDAEENEGKSEITANSIIPSGIAIPRPGEGVVGLLFADPCFRSGSATTFLACEYSKKFHTYERTPALINVFINGTHEESTDLNHGRESTSIDAVTGLSLNRSKGTRGIQSTESPQITYWGILGDNFYDRSGKGTDEFFDLLSLEVKKKPMITVHGNHDFWLLGAPEAGTVLDQCGNALTQYYGQDTKSAIGKRTRPGMVEKGDEDYDPTSPIANPYNLTIDPYEGHHFLGCNILSQDNTFWASQIGNLFYIGYSASHSWELQKQDFADACRHASEHKDTIASIILVGHWNWCSPGCDRSNDMAMDVPQVSSRMLQMEDCKEFMKPSSPLGVTTGVQLEIRERRSSDDMQVKRQKQDNIEQTRIGQENKMQDRSGQPVAEPLYSRRIRHITGHTHCNNKDSDRKGGYMVAGFGMEGCGDYGIPIFDSTNNRFRVYYFFIAGHKMTSLERDISTEDQKRTFRDQDPDSNYQDIMSCVAVNGWRNCLHLAEMWTDEPLMDEVYMSISGQTAGASDAEETAVYV